MSTPLWRQLLVPAFFRMAPFHVERELARLGAANRAARISETRHALCRGHGPQGALVPRYRLCDRSRLQIWRELLVAALEMEGPGLLILPTLLQRDTILVQPRDYTVRETRQQAAWPSSR